MKFILIIALLVSGAATMAQGSTKEDVQKYADKGFTISYPRHWKNETSGMLGTICFIYAPADDSTDKFRENVNVLIQDLKGMNIDLEKYKEITEKQLTNFFPNSKPEESIIKGEGDQRFYSLRYTMDKDGVTIKIISKCYIKDEKAFLATFGAESKRYELYKKIEEDCMNSFNLIIDEIAQ